MKENQKTGNYRTIPKLLPLSSCLSARGWGIANIFSNKKYSLECFQDINLGLVSRVKNYLNQ